MQVCVYLRKCYDAIMRVCVPHYTVSVRVCVRVSHRKQSLTITVIHLKRVLTILTVSRTTTATKTHVKERFGRRTKKKKERLDIFLDLIALGQTSLI